jgi:hypothetical protein
MFQKRRFSRSAAPRYAYNVWSLAHRGTKVGKNAKPIRASLKLLKHGRSCNARTLEGIDAEYRNLSLVSEHLLLIRTGKIFG